MSWTYEDVIPTLVPNTTMQKKLLDGVHKVYIIEPNEGYVLHDNRTYGIILDDELNETRYPRFATGDMSVSANYDFNNTTQGTYEGVDGVTYNVTKIGEYELYTLPASAVDVAHTYGGGNDHVVASVEEPTEPVNE